MQVSTSDRKRCWSTCKCNNWPSRWWVFLFPGYKMKLTYIPTNHSTSPTDNPNVQYHRLINITFTWLRIADIIVETRVPIQLRTNKIYIVCIPKGFEWITTFGVTGSPFMITFPWKSLSFWMAEGFSFRYWPNLVWQFVRGKEVLHWNDTMIFFHSLYIEIFPKWHLNL